MLPAILEQTTLADVQNLVTGRVPESIKLDYKRDNYRINNTDAEDKKKQCKELLKDTSAFANTAGGELIIGVDEPKGRTGSVVGIETADADNLKRQMIDIIRNGTDPKIAFTIHTIELSTDRHVFIIRVRPSSHGPHRVVYKGEQGPFYCRNSGGVHEMTAREVAELSRQSESRIQRIESFRKERVEAIQRNEGQIPLSTPHQMIIHIIPEEAFDGFEVHTQDLLPFGSNMPMLHPTGGWTHQYNTDGIVRFDRAPGIPTYGYTQLYRNGIVESVADDITFFLRDDTRHRLFKTDYLHMIHSPMKNYFTLMARLEIPLPAWFFMSFIGLNGVEILPRDITGRYGHPISQSLILCPRQEFQDLKVDVKSILKPGFDQLWNAAGYSQSTL